MLPVELKKRHDSNDSLEMDFNGKEVDLDKYTSKYSDGEFWDKVKTTVKKAGLGLIYNALQLYYVTESPACPTKVKAGIYAALGYFISPIDLIPDFTPIVGFADDATAVGMALVLAQVYIDDEVKAKARGKIHDMFGMKAVEKLPRDDEEASA